MKPAGIHEEEGFPGKPQPIAQFICLFPGNWLKTSEVHPVGDPGHPVRGIPGLAEFFGDVTADGDELVGPSQQLVPHPQRALEQTHTQPARLPVLPGE
jgi:hypothetical protein